jgi:hypothetical protein
LEEKKLHGIYHLAEVRASGVVSADAKLWIGAIRLGILRESRELLLSD